MDRISNTPGAARKFPRYFLRRQTRLVRLSTLELLDRFQTYAKAFRDGKDYLSAYKIAETVTALEGYEKQPRQVHEKHAKIVTAASEALANIKLTKDDIDLGLGRFGFQALSPTPFLVGTFLELLPPAYAHRIFGHLFNPDVKYITADKITGGMALLCFSSAPKGAEFVRALDEQKLAAKE